MIRRVVFVVILAALFTASSGCGSSDANALGPTDDHLDDIRSARLDLRLTLSADEGVEPVGFELSGPFSFDSDGDLPVARLEHRRLLAGDIVETTFTSTGSEAFLRVDGVDYRLDDEQLATLRLAGDDAGTGLERLSLSDWIDDPVEHAGDTTDGEPTTRITGAAEPAAVLNDLRSLAAQLGLDTDSFPAIEQDDELLRRSVSSTSVELITGSDDHLLRVVDVRIEFGPTPLAGNDDDTGAILQLHMELTNLNEPIHVDVPPDPQPISELTTP